MTQLQWKVIRTKHFIVYTAGIYLVEAHKRGMAQAYWGHHDHNLPALLSEDQFLTPEEAIAFCEGHNHALVHHKEKV